MASNDFIYGMELPTVLDRTELNSYFEKYHSGDLHARDVIIFHNMKLVLYIVSKKFLNFPYDRNELASVGMIGLIKAVDRFDFSKKVSFHTFAHKCIVNEILMFIRQEKKHFDVDSIQRPIQFGYKELDSELTVSDTVSDTSFDFVQDLEDKQIKMRILEIIDGLPERERKMIELYFGFIDDKPLTQQEIAKKLFVDQSYVSRILARTLRKIKIILEKETQDDHRATYSRTFPTMIVSKQVGNAIHEVEHKKTEKNQVNMRGLSLDDACVEDDKEVSVKVLEILR